MTEEILQNAKNISDRLCSVKYDRERFKQNRVDFRFMHGSFPWYLFSDEEWDRMEATITERFDQQIAELETEFASL